MCGGHHVAAGGGKVLEFGGRLMDLEAGDVRGDVVNQFVRFRVMNIGKALLSTQDLSRCGNAYLVRKASNTRITLVKKRCAWYLRVKLKPHNELPYSEGEEFLEVMSMDQRAGVWPVEGGGGSSSSGPAVPEDVEEGEPVKKLDSTNSTRPRRAHAQWACSVRKLVSWVLHRTWPNASTSCRWKRDHDSSDCH